MAIDEKALQQLIDKDAIRDLVLCYSRAIDRKDVELLRDLYTEDATDTHGTSFDGPADKYCDFIAASLPYMNYSGHHACNHMVAKFFHRVHFFRPFVFPIEFQFRGALQVRPSSNTHGTTIPIS